MTRLPALLALATLAGCEDRELAQLEAVRAEVCACTTAACVDTAFAKLPRGDIPSDRRAQAIARAMMDCVAKASVQAIEAAKAADDPDRAGSAAPTRP